MTRGYAFVYLKNEADVDKVIELVDGRHLRQRQIRIRKYMAKEGGDREGGSTYRKK